jgi:multiple sugar transport system ATP-binding protein
VLQQVDQPQTLYEHPDNLFVAGFIGSPAMNLVEATLEERDGKVVTTFAGFTLVVPDEMLQARPALRVHTGRTLVLGIRPEDMEDASLVPDAPDDRRIRSKVELREALGSDVVVHFTIAAPPAITEDTKELAADVGREALEAVEQRGKGGESNVLARLNPRTRVQTGDEVELVVDTNRLHFFDPDTGTAIYTEP